MHNNIPYGTIPQGPTFEDLNVLQYNSQQFLSTNRLIFLKQQVQEVPQSVNVPQRVLVNPHFKANSKVFVNPNFAGSTTYGSSIHVNPRHGSQGTKTPSNINLPSKALQNTKIHINPNAKGVHINPKFAKVAATTINDVSSVTSAIETPICSAKENVNVIAKLNNVVVLTRTKLIRTSHVPTRSPRLTRRHSVKSNYKIIKTGLSPKKNSNITIRNKSRSGSNIVAKSRFKIDNRRRSLTVISKHQRKYIYVNTLMNTSQFATSRIIKSCPLKSVKHSSEVSINGIAYRKSRNSLRRTSVPSIKEVDKQNISTNSSTKTSALQTRNKIVKKFKIIRKLSPNKKNKISLKTLRKCNIPCPSFKKYGTCKGKDNGKCIWKHDPDQIALCTRFLQGACLKGNCLLSHNVSPEKMPTCKYYLEGSCSRENCPYLHVKISPKAEVCRDFLEGFCKKAAECDKRHQYLCPDYEKHGECAKQRCPYPHGKMVRTYLINKNKFAKKCSENKKREQNLLREPGESKTSKNDAQMNDKRRYYAEEGADLCGKQLEKLKNFVGLQSRPKLGSLPTFIPFKES